MKRSYKWILLCTIAIVGCGPNKSMPTKGSATFHDEAANTKSSRVLPTSVANTDQAKFYEFSDPDTNCTTFQRTYLSHDELCLGLQSQWWNNSCASDQRKKYFQKNCLDKTWDPEGVTDSWGKIGSNGFSCVIGHKQADNPGVQGTVGDQLIMQHTDFKVVATREIGTTAMNLVVEIQDLDGKTLATNSKAWALPVNGDSGSLIVEYPDKNAVAACVPKIVEFHYQQ